MYSFCSPFVIIFKIVFFVNVPLQLQAEVAWLHVSSYLLEESKVPHDICEFSYCQKYMFSAKLVYSEST